MTWQALIRHGWMQAAEAAASKLGVGVSRGGQHLFDTLSKTLPCKWAGKDIVVLQQVLHPQTWLVCHLRQLHDSMLVSTNACMPGATTTSTGRIASMKIANSTSCGFKHV